jgi:hypothetical protein
MKKFFMSTFAALMLAISAELQSLAQDSFAYQAVIRDAQGELITNKEVSLRFSLMNGDSTYYIETQKAKTNQFGNIDVNIGTGNAEQGAMENVPWNTLDIRMKVEVDADGGSKFATLGETQLLPAPYVMYAAAGGSASSASATKGGESLFEVADNNGNPVFAVTPNGIVVYVDDTNLGDGGKAARSGFIVTGRTAAKDGKSNDYFAVTADGTQVFIDDDPSKAARSGFIVTGRTASKSGESADSQSKAARTADADLFAIDGSLTTVYVDEDAEGKAARSGFVVTGRTASKGGKIVDINAKQTNFVTSEFTVMEKVAEPVDPIIDPSGEPEPAQPKSLFTISGGQVEVGTEITMIGDVAQKVEAEEVELAEPVESIDVNEALFSIVCNEYDSYLNIGGETMANYALLAIYDQGSYVPVQPTNGEYVLTFDENGNITKQHKKAALLMVLRNTASEAPRIYIRTLKPMQQTIEFGLMDAANANTEPYQFVKLTANVNVEEGYPFIAETQGGKINVSGDLFYGETVTFTALPDDSWIFGNWSDMEDVPEDNRRSEYISLDFETLSANFVSSVYYVSSKGKEENSGVDEAHALQSITQAVERIKGNIVEYHLLEKDWTIKVVGKVTGIHEISGNELVANSITITGTSKKSELNGNEEGTVLTNNVTVPIIISNLKITNGSASNDTEESSSGGGIYNDGGTITLQSGAQVTKNYAKLRGGGIFNNGGTIVMESGSSVSNNKVEDTYGNSAYRGGGGILTKGGIVTINSGATISGNEATGRGGGIMLFDKAQVTLNGGTIKGNTAGMFGGGVMFGNASVQTSLEWNSTFTMKSGSIEDNTMENCGDWNGGGGGVFVVWGEFILEGGSIKNNQAFYSGGGVHVYGPIENVYTATLTMRGGDISMNKVQYSEGGWSDGGCGVFNQGIFNMSGGTISGNSFVDTGDNRKGFGIYNHGILSMSGTATVADGNDIYVVGNSEDGEHPITLGEFDEEINAVATITPSNFNNVQLLKGNLDNASLFTLNVNGAPSGNWIINSDGYLEMPPIILPIGNVASYISGMSENEYAEIIVTGECSNNYIDAMQDELFKLWKDDDPTVSLDFSRTTWPDNITETFRFSRGLKSLVLPETVQNIPSWMFADCPKLEYVYIPNSVKTIGYGAFLDCDKLVLEALPSSLTTISDEAFCGCESLKELDISASVTTIGDGAFSNCGDLTLTFAEDNPFDFEDGVMYSDSRSQIVFCMASKTGAFEIPSSVKYIQSSAFRGSKLSEITFADGINLSKIDTYAFSKSAITSIELPNSITTLSRSQFEDCANLESVTILNNDSFTVIGDQVFAGCENLKSITIPTSLTKIEVSAFNRCSSLSTVKYCGTDEQKDALRANIDRNNDDILNADWTCE